jgi:hypothetical protein
VSHSTCTHRGRVDSRLLMVGSQIANLTPSPSFAHNLCCKCLNASCKAIFDIYASRHFQQYKDHFKTSCFDPWNWVLSFRKSWRTPQVPISGVWVSSSHSFKVGSWGTFDKLQRNNFITMFQKKLNLLQFEKLTKHDTLRTKEILNKYVLQH